ncbi:MAG: hypothetical protein ACLFQK_11325 [Fibrobacterota bacterium]
MNTGGWIMMLGSVSLVLVLNIFTFWKILSEKDPSEKHHAPLDVETGEED